MTGKRRRKGAKAKRKGAAGPPGARIPLPRKGEARHGDATKYDRAREKRRLRDEVRGPEGAK
jgi:hypothetical protein